MKQTSCLAALLLLFLAASCSHPSTVGRLVGSDLDEHGCKGSAGYTWSYALNDCVRVWEVGERFSNGQSGVLLVFSPDSLYAEVFTSEGGHVLCKRKKGQDFWRARKGSNQVSVRNGVTTIHVGSVTYTKAAEAD